MTSITDAEIFEAMCASRPRLRQLHNELKEAAVAPHDLRRKWAQEIYHELEFILANKPALLRAVREQFGEVYKLPEPRWGTR